MKGNVKLSFRNLKTIYLAHLPLFFVTDAHICWQRSLMTNIWPFPGTSYSLVPQPSETGSNFELKQTFPVGCRL